METTQPLGPVLVVDDEPNDVLLLQRAATRAMLANPIHVAAGGEEAVAYLTDLLSAPSSRVAPVVVLLDLKMPRMSGFEVLEWLRQQPSLRRLPVAVFTSSNQDPDIARAYDLGANSYLVKPVTFANLVEMIRAVGLYWAIHNRAPKLVSTSGSP